MVNNTNNDKFKSKVAEWRGYVVRALEDIDREIKELKQAISDLDDKQDVNISRIYNKINNLGTSVTNLKVKIGGMSATIAIILSLFISYLCSIL